MTDVIDLFAGPGGWDVGARRLGIDPLGVETDRSACLTREAAGLRTVRADVAQLDPADYAPARGLIASPPCQAWSLAGHGRGRRDIDEVYAATRDIAAGQDTRAAHAARCEDPRSILVVEPLRWALALRPAWLAFEQVPPVLPYWHAVADVLAGHGWATWAGVLEAERYGVPQTRERAILLARRGAPVSPPAPTHQRYVPGVAPAPADDLFGGTLAPWVSMADALGWGAADRPAPTLAAGKTGDGRVFGSDSRSSDRFGASRDRGAWVYRAGQQAKQAVRRADEPAPTLSFGHDAARAGWAPADDPSDVAVRITIEEAACLQSFPPGYPWRGAPTRIYEQIGNAVPPDLASAILSAVAVASEEAAA